MTIIFIIIIEDTMSTWNLLFVSDNISNHSVLHYTYVFSFSWSRVKKVIQRFLVEALQFEKKKLSF